jgi:hypothetical protein
MATFKGKMSQFPKGKMIDFLNNQFPKGEMNQKRHLFPPEFAM